MSTIQRAMITCICAVLLCLTVANTVHAAIKVTVLVTPISFDGTTVVMRLTVDKGDSATLTTNRSVSAAGIADPATVVTSIKNLVITFMLNQYGQTILATEILVYGAPQ